EELKERGVWIVGADMAGEKSLFDENLTGSIALVIGSEGKGISRLLKEACDFLVQIPMLGEIESLNASVAAAIMMYEVVRQRRNR
ncbi:MAG: RNA methyltransferase, partial [Clostridia bacterium]|nr:RNA methyltransferase [Clostridia bacterium]